MTERFSIFEIKFRSYWSLCYSTAEHILRVSWAGGKMRSFTTFADYTLSQSHIDCRHHTQSFKNQILFTFLLTGGHKVVSKIWFPLWRDFRFILLLFFCFRLSSNFHDILTICTIWMWCNSFINITQWRKWLLYKAVATLRSNNLSK